MSDRSDVIAVIEGALARIRREQQRAALARRDGVARRGDARFRALDVLDDRPEGASAAAVADAIGVDRPRASRILAALADDDLVTREPDAADARIVLSRLTPSGRSVVERMRSNRRDAVASALDAFDDADAASLASLLDRFTRAWGDRS